MPKPRPCPPLGHLILCAFMALFLTQGHARAENGVPEGTLGWWYYTGILREDRYAADPVTACQKSAANHTGQPLAAMRPYKDRRDFFECHYKLHAQGRVSWLAEAVLRCKAGYKTYGQSFCRKAGQEPPAPLRCGAAAGNPVQFASGAKVQHETDLEGGINDALRIQRTESLSRQAGVAVGAPGRRGRRCSSLHG